MRVRHVLPYVDPGPAAGRSACHNNRRPVKAEPLSCASTLFVAKLVPSRHHAVMAELAHDESHSGHGCALQIHLWTHARHTS